MSGISYTRVDYVRRVPLNQDETMQGFAARVLGDASQWVDIANLNSLLPPYVTGDLAVAAAGNVALYGSYLRVPGAVPLIDYHDDAELMFERDLDLSTGGLTDEDGDIRLLSGIDNLHQALTIRVVTALRELMFHPRYGCDVRRLIGASSGPLAVVAAGAYVKGAVEADPRIERVTTATSEAVGDSLKVTCECIPIYGPPRRVELVI